MCGQIHVSCSFALGQWVALSSRGLRAVDLKERRAERLEGGDFPHRMVSGTTEPQRGPSLPWGPGYFIRPQRGYLRAVGTSG